MSISTVSQSQLGQDTAKNSQVVTTVVKNFNSGTLGSGPSITSVVVTDSSYNNLDDTAVTTSNGYIKIIGTGFTSTANVYVGSNAVPAANVTFVSSTEIRARVPVLSAGNYSLSLFNSNSSGAISSSTFIVSTGPAWVTGATLTNQASGTAFNVSLSATSDSNITYANTSALPAGTTLAANGYFSGTVTTGSETTFSFDVKATDIENQDASRTFSLTVTVIQDYRLYSWGTNGSGELGLNSQGNYARKSSPTQVGASTDWSNQVTVQSSVAAAVKDNGTLWTWGSGSTGAGGALGLNDTIDRSSPTQVGTDTNWSSVSTGSLSTFAIKTNGTLWAWGNRGAGQNYGQLGLNSDAYRSSPTQVGASTDWSLVRTFSYSTVAIKTNGTLWAWGRNSDGRLGLNDTSNKSSPTQVGSSTNWSKVEMANDYCAAIKTDGTLWVWGNNNDGQLGLNDTVKRSSPTQVGALTNWSLISPSFENSLAIKTDGTLWGWGANAGYAGTLGLNDTVSRSSPTQIGSDTSWSLVRTFATVTGAIKTNGTLWMWGNNNNGQLGFNTTYQSKSSPTQLGTGTNWVQIRAGNPTFGVTLN